MRRLITPLTFALLVTTGCTPRVPVVAPLDQRAPRWAEWAGRVEALPLCLPPELERAPTDPPSFAPGDTVHLRGRLGLLELDCSGMINELILRGLWLPDPNAVRSLPEIASAAALRSACEPAPDDGPRRLGRSSRRGVA